MIEKSHYQIRHVRGPYCRALFLLNTKKGGIFIEKFLFVLLRGDRIETMVLKGPESIYYNMKFKIIVRFVRVKSDCIGAK